MLEQHLHDIKSEKSRLQEENQKLLHENDELTAHYKMALHANKLECISLFHQLLSKNYISAYFFNFVKKISFSSTVL